MNLKLMAFASVAVSLAAAAGCVTQPVGLGAGGAGGAGVVDVATSSQAASTSTAAGGNTDSAARKYYVANVDPALATGAQPCKSCHVTGLSGAPIYLTTDAEGSYAAIEAFPGGGLIALPSNSLLILHGKHTGPALSQAQSDTITTWLNMEAMERGLNMAGGSTSTSAASSSSGGGPTKPADLASALTMFAKCMDINDWTANGLQNLAKVNTNNNQGQCQACHITGDYGNLLNGSNNGGTNITFDAQKDFPYIKRWVSGTYDMNGNFVALKAVPREYLKADEAAKCDKAKEACHPTFTMAAALKTGIDTFISKTLAKMDANMCP